MSVVTNIIIHFSILEDRGNVVGYLNSFPIKGVPLRTLGYDDSTAGDKELETYLMVGAFNYFDLEGFLKHVRHYVWKDREDVQVFVMGQEEDTFTERFQ